MKKLLCHRRLTKKTLVQVLSPFVFLNLRHLSKYFAQIYRARYTNMAAGKYCKGKFIYHDKKREGGGGGKMKILKLEA